MCSGGVCISDILETHPDSQVALHLHADEQAVEFFAQSLSLKIIPINREYNSALSTTKCQINTDSQANLDKKNSL